ncbi:MAG TPA: triose-phosphate isomerase [Planctomycetaceae bacterium]|nr:triose-phosphate isomerase [Planctomycetaceae bacterium]
MRRPMIAGNWKMNTDLASGTELAKGLASHVAGKDSSVDVLVCPPYPYLQAIKEAVGDSGISVGAQNCYFEESGAFTGEVSVDMLQDIGCDWVILGHSERRHVLGECDGTINKKNKAAIAKGLGVVLCVGELLEEREADKTGEVLDTQMKGGLADVSEADLSKIIIAYEPVWAIGTGKTASPEQADEAHAHLRKWLSSNYSEAAAEAMRILYGGSVKPSNAEELLGQPNVDGALVGGASLTVENFGPIIDAGRTK